MSKTDYVRDPLSQDPLVTPERSYKPTVYQSAVFSQREKTEILSQVPTAWSLDLHESEPQLTLKAIIAGMIIGMLCSFLALYYGLKTGAIPSLNILAGIGGFVLVRAMLKLRIFGQTFTPQENAVIQTFAVATYAVSSTGFGFTSGYLALGKGSWEEMGGDSVEGNLIEDTVDLTWPRSFVWCLALAYFGFFIAFPIRDYVILRQKLCFPSGTVTAFVVKSMHDSVEKATTNFAILSKFFAVSFIVNIATWLWNGISSFPIFGMQAANFGWSFDWDLGVFGIGMILSPVVNFSMLLGALSTYGFLWPYVQKHHTSGPDAWYEDDPDKSPFLRYQAYFVFGGLAMMIVQGVYSIVMLVIRLVSDSRKAKKDRRAAEAARAGGLGDEMEAGHRSKTVVLNEIFLRSRLPVWVPYVGFLLACALCIVVLDIEFKVKWYQTIVALCVVPIFAMSNIQGMGRTDWDVASSYGKLMMFPFGLWNLHKSIIPSLVLCVTTISGCSNAGSLLQDFKTGYLLGASPTSMFIAQSLGQLWGCFVTPTLFALITRAFKVPNISDPHAFVQGMYGPIYRTLAVVAAGEGFSSLPKNVLWVSLAFLLLAILLDALELLLPERFKKFVPDASAFSIGMLVPATVSLEFTVGGCIGYMWSWWKPYEASQSIPYVASGLVAGSGIAVVVQCLLTLAGITSPVTVVFESATKHLNGGLLALAIICGLFCAAVGACGLWFWFQTGGYSEPPPEMIEESFTSVDKDSPTVNTDGSATSAEKVATS